MPKGTTDVGEAREFAVRADDGSLSDAALHDEILDNPEAERSSLLRCRERALAQGMSPEDVDRYLPLPV